MKLTFLSYLVAGAGILQYVCANPIRVVVVTSHQEMSTNIDMNKDHNSAVAHLARPDVPFSSDMQTAGPKHAKPHRPCGSNFRAKAIQFSNALRQAMGLPLIEADPKVSNNAHGNAIHILPVYPIGDPTRIPNERHGVHFAYRPHNSFLKRVHMALMALNVWEGRAVAFVLGCGIGVLLRMMWVMAILSYRAIRGEREDPAEYTELIIETEHLLAPPSYVYSDEKEEKIESAKPDTTEI